MQFHNEVNKGCYCIALKASDSIMSLCGSPDYLSVLKFFTTCYFMTFVLHPLSQGDLMMSCGSHLIVTINHVIIT